MKIATIRLQWNRKAKMMRAVKFFQHFEILLRLKRRLPATTKGFIQMINTLKRAAKLAPWLAVAAIFATAAPACASAEPGATRRHQIPVPLRLYGALLQRAAGRRGFAAMPAEEHVEPVIELPERGARRGSAGGGDRQAGRDRGAESRGARGCNSSAGEIRRAKGCSGSRRGTADQRADFRHPQRMPLRLSKGLRRRADRRRAGAAMPGKEQGETLAPVARKPSPPPAAVARSGAPRQARLRPQRERLPPLHRRRRP